MGPIDYVLIAGIAMVLGGIVFFVIRAKKKGKKCIGCPDSGGCSGNCAGCGGHCGCGSDIK